MKTRPPPKPRRVTRQDAKKLIAEDSETDIPPFAVDASGASDLGAQDIANWTANAAPELPPLEPMQGGPLPQPLLSMHLAFPAPPALPVWRQYALRLVILGMSKEDPRLQMTLWEASDRRT